MVTTEEVSVQFALPPGKGVEEGNAYHRSCIWEKLSSKYMHILTPFHCSQKVERKVVMSA